VQAYFFNCSLLLEGDAYTFGKLVIHETVLNEIKKWQNSSLKIKRFTLPIIISMIAKCTQLVVSTPQLPQPERDKYFRWISRAEEELDDSDKSETTTFADKMYLALAFKCKGNIATHETSLRSITRKTIGNERLFSVGKMIEDRRISGFITDKNILLDGLSNLEQFDEKLMRDDKQLVIKIIASM
jgi:hypothetical protein